jgi:hypothetical protein
VLRECVLAAGRPPVHALVAASSKEPPPAVLADGDLAPPADVRAADRPVPWWPVAAWSRLPGAGRVELQVAVQGQRRAVARWTRVVAAEAVLSAAAERWRRAASAGVAPPVLAALSALSALAVAGPVVAVVRWAPVPSVAGERPASAVRGLVPPWVEASC